MENNNFKDFTNLYELSKTLRFELRPIWWTKELIQKNNIIQLDKKKRENYEKVKPYFNKIHLEFINFSLKNPNFNFSEFKEKYINWIKEKKNKDLMKEKEKIDKILLEKIWKLFESSVKDFLKENNFLEKIEEKDQNINFLYKEEIFEILQEKYGSELETQIIGKDGEIKSIFNWWKGWLWYFNKFFNTRENFYKVDWTSTAIATRIIKDNLQIFLENTVVFDKIKNKEINFSEVEKIFSIDVNLFFEINNFNNYFLQDWIDSYNKIIWWETLENWEKLKWLNEIINKYRQDTGEKIPYFKKLQKQILSEKSWNFIEEIENNDEFNDVLKKFYKNSLEKVQFLKDTFENLYNISDKNLEKIYFNKIAFNTISHKFWNAQEFEKIIYEEMKKEKVTWIKFDKKEEKYKFPDFIEIIFIKKALENHASENLFWKERYYKSEENKNWLLERNNKNLWEQFCKILNFEFLNILKREIIDESWNKLEIGFDISKNRLWKKLKNFDFNQENKWIIKDFADYSLTLYSFWKYFAVEKGRKWDLSIDTDDNFYDEYIEKFYENWYDEIVNPYNLMRNYISKKPWEDNKKWKLNFGHSKLLWGFAESKTEKSDNWTQYGGYLFRKKEEDGKYTYYLGVSKNAKLFRRDDVFINVDQPTWYDRLHYRQVMTRSIYGSSYDWDFKKDKETLPEEKIIEKIKKSLENYTEIITDFNSLITKKGLSLQDIQKKIGDLVREKWIQSIYKPVSERQLSEANSTEDWFFLFQIHSKDIYLSTEQKNLHSLYLLEVLNNETSVFTLWTWEIFFQNKLEDKSLWRKKDKKGKEIINHKRFARDKITLHLSIVQNSWSSPIPNTEKGKRKFRNEFNQKINEFLANNPDINIIWIDRWEKHLAYFSVINQKWEIIESWSFNTIENYDKNWEKIAYPEREIKEIYQDWKLTDLELVETWKKVNYVDYKLLLEYKERKRILQRQSWKEVEQIKDLKKWYISILVRKIADLIIKHNAIIVFEDLNFRFKQIRGWIEKSIYQQLEKALIDKLSFLVNKNEINPEKAGNILKAYQLAVPVDSLKQIWKQTWVIFYTEAAYTSKIDPITWWRPNLYLKKQSAEINKENILKFDNIIYNKEKNRFEFTYDLKKFLWKDSKFPQKTVWTVCSSVERFKWNKFLANNRWDYDHYTSLTDWKLSNRELKEDEFSNFKELFKKYSIDINWNILEQIKNLKTKNNEKFFAEFINLFSLICQIRNTKKDVKWDENDFILSPVESFFDSRNSKKFWKNLPKNWDDNWAYNIARKGLIILDRISKDSENPDLIISHKDWDDFSQNI